MCLRRLEFHKVEKGQRGRKHGRVQGCWNRLSFSEEGHGIPMAVAEGCRSLLEEFRVTLESCAIFPRDRYAIRMATPRSTRPNRAGMNQRSATVGAAEASPSVDPVSDPTDD